MKLATKLAFFILIFWGFLFFSCPPALAAVSFSLSPDSGSFSLGTTFNVSIILDTGGEDVDAVSAVLFYDPAVLEVQDADLDTEGIQITPGGILPWYLLNKVLPAERKIQIDACSVEITDGDLTFIPFNGRGTFGTIKFKVLQATETQVNFDFTSGEAGDSDVYQLDNDNDLLGSVSGAVFNSSAPPESTPTPTPTPTPPPGASPTPTLPPGVTPTPTPLSRTSMPSTDEGVPESGFIAPTIIMSLLGLGLIFLGVRI